MGLGMAAIKLNLELWQRGLFENIKSIIDIGSQELHLKQADFEGLIMRAGIDYKKEDFSNLGNFPEYPRCTAKPFYKMLGVKDYSCIDLNQEHDAVKHDLNLPLEDKSLYAKYDMVTDHGCNEHAFNIAEAYRTIHRLCKKLGLMVVIQSVYKTNGYYLFDLSFFEGIAAANNYKILFSSYVIGLKEPTKAGGLNEFHIPLSRELLDTINYLKIRTVEICYVMQKQSDSDFKCPYQDTYMLEKFGNHGYQMQFLPDPPSRTYVPMHKSILEITPTKTLINHIKGRMIKKIRRRRDG